MDRETGMYYYGARYYDPRISIFVSVDPLAEQFPNYGGYVYTMNNPVNLVDPTGMAPEDTDPPGGKETKDQAESKPAQFIRGVGDGFSAGWEDTKGFIKSLGTEEGWLGLIRSTETMFSPAIYSNGDSYVKNERQQIYNSVSYKLSNLDKLSSYDWGYGFGYVSEKLVEGLATRRFATPTTADGFLFGGVTVRTPFNIPVQRFGNMSTARADFWGAQIGTGRFTNRTFAAIKPEWNPLTQYTTGIIPKGTTVKFGIIGPQGWKYPGGSFQFIVPSRNVINQSSKLTN